jgi:hypothetical protein
MQSGISGRPPLYLFGDLVAIAHQQPQVAAALGRGKLLELLLEEGLRLKAGGKHAEVRSPAPLLARCLARQLPTTSMLPLH